MAIPIRTTLTCPACGASEDITMGDTSVGPRGRVSETPIYAFLRNDNWPVTRRDGEEWISCAACGETEFTTVAKQGRSRLRAPAAKAIRVKKNNLTAARARRGIDASKPKPVKR